MEARALRRGDLERGTSSSAWIGSAWARRERDLHNPTLPSTPGVWQYAIAFKTWAEFHHWNLAAHLLAKMPTYRLRPDSVCFRTVADGCCNVALWRAALTSLSSMQTSAAEKTRVLPADSVSAKSAMRAWRASGHWSKAQHVFDALRRTSLRQDVRACNIVMDANARAGRWKAAMRLLHCSAKQTLQLSQVSYNSLYRAVASGAVWMLALESIRISRSESMNMDRIGLNTILDGLATVGLWHHSLCQLFSSRLRDTISYNSAASAALAGFLGSWASALQLLRELTESALIPDIFTRSFSIRASRRWSSALKLIREARGARSRLGDVIYVEGLRACRPPGVRGTPSACFGLRVLPCSPGTCLAGRPRRGLQR